jgi:hypothetical protein
MYCEISSHTWITHLCICTSDVYRIVFKQGLQSTQWNITFILWAPLSSFIITTFTTTFNIVFNYLAKKFLVNIFYLLVFIERIESVFSHSYKEVGHVIQFGR